MEHKIKDYEQYNSSMTKTLLDKIFFMDKIEFDVLVDYGCANGALLKFLAMLFPENTYVGYDIDPAMIEQAQEEAPENCSFTTNWQEVEKLINKRTSTVLLSSVIHEVFAYGTRKDVDTMWSRIYTSGFDFIVIRDMIPSTTIDKISQINDVKNIMKKGTSNTLHDFEQVWGSIEQNKNLIHYLLKYRYVDNWDREVRENYFPITREELLTTIPEEYYIDFHEHFILPFLRNVVKKDFNITIKDNTHLKLILRNTKGEN